MVSRYTSKTIASKIFDARQVGLLEHQNFDARRLKTETSETFADSQYTFIYQVFNFKIKVSSS